MVLWSMGLKWILGSEIICSVDVMECLRYIWHKWMSKVVDWIAGMSEMIGSSVCFVRKPVSHLHSFAKSKNKVHVCICHLNIWYMLIIFKPHLWNGDGHYYSLLDRRKQSALVTFQRSHSGSKDCELLKDRCCLIVILISGRWMVG